MRGFLFVEGHSGARAWGQIIRGLCRDGGSRGRVLGRHCDVDSPPMLVVVVARRAADTHDSSKVHVKVLARGSQVTSVSLVTSTGWYLDPFQMHVERWFTEGRPTSLVRDGREESQDPPPFDAYDGELDEAPVAHAPDGRDQLRAGESTRWPPSPKEQGQAATDAWAAGGGMFT